MTIRNRKADIGGILEISSDGAKKYRQSSMTSPIKYAIQANLTGMTLYSSDETSIEDHLTPPAQASVASPAHEVRGVPGFVKRICAHSLWQP